MRIFFSMVSAVVVCVLCFSFNSETKTKDRLLEIDWQKELKGDFSFSEKWSYPVGVYKNRWGQLSCDGICPQEIDSMKDSSGRIYEDSLSRFYSVVDTTHLPHSLFAQGAMYEWAGSNWMNFEKKEDGSIHGESTCDAATHTSIHIKIKDDSVMVWLDYNSIYEEGRHIFPLQKGWIKIDKKRFRKGIVKAQFRFDFNNTLEALVPLNCEGLIYSEIK